jgi:hypothetical protein
MKTRHLYTVAIRMSLSLNGDGVGVQSFVHIPAILALMVITTAGVRLALSMAITITPNTRRGSIAVSANPAKPISRLELIARMGQEWRELRAKYPEGRPDLDPNRYGWRWWALGVAIVALAEEEYQVDHWREIYQRSGESYEQK